MSLLDAYIYEEHTDLSDIANSSSGDCYSPNECAAVEISRSSYKFEVCFSKLPIVRTYTGGIPIITNFDEFARTYHKSIEMIFESNNMFRSWTSPLWLTSGPFTELSFENVQRDIEAVITYGFEISETISPNSVMRFVSQIFQIPLSGETTVSISKNNSSSNPPILIQLGDHSRNRMFYDSLRRMDVLKNLVRTFTQDESKTNFHRLQKVIGRYRVYGRPDGCVNYADISEEMMPWENFEHWRNDNKLKNKGNYIPVATSI